MIRNKNGFTLIELIVVIAIIAILSLILVPVVRGYVDNANESSDKANAKTCYTEALIVWQIYVGELSNSSIVIDDGCEINPTSGDNYNPEIDGLPISGSYGNWIYNGSSNTVSEIE